MIFHVEYIIELITHQSTSESHYLYLVIYQEIFFDFEQGRTDFPRGVRGLTGYKYISVSDRFFGM